MHEVEINRQVSIILVNNQFSCRSHYLLEFMEYHFHKWSPPCTQMRTFGRQRQRMSSFTIPASCLAMTADWYIRTRSILSCSACELCIGIWMVFSDRRAYITASAGVHTSRIARAHTEPGRCAMHTMHISPICFFFIIRIYVALTVWLWLHSAYAECNVQSSSIQSTVLCDYIMWFGPKLEWEFAAAAAHSVLLFVVVAGSFSGRQYMSVRPMRCRIHSHLPANVILM